MSTLENLPHGPNGHWYCSFCNDVVNIRKPAGRWDTRKGEICPVCHNSSADWIADVAPISAKPAGGPPAPVSPEKAKEMFDNIYARIKQLPEDGE